MNEKYDVIIGLEVHIQSKTNSKVFCSCDSKYFNDEPNTHVCPVCLGLPGALPIPNKKAIELCILLGLATNCDIEDEIRFDRKHYFYPDLPKGYQISQYDQPICSDGFITITDQNGNSRKVDIERIHQEEDVAKALHKTDSDGKEYTLVDYNKSGMPLIEIVSRPVIHSAYEAKEYCTKIRQIARYLGVSDADMEKGQMRCEPNISVQEKGKWEYKDGEIEALGDYKLNPKVEIKNIGSLSAVEKSIEYEIDRLIQMIESGEKIVQQTRGWNPERSITEFQRTKETAQDYRYFPEPDIPIITLSKEDIDAIANNLIELPDERIKRYVEISGLSEYDASVIASSREISDYYDLLLQKLNDSSLSKELANWLTGSIFALSNNLNRSIQELNIDEDSFIELVKLVAQKKLNINKAREILELSITQRMDLNKLIKENLGNVVSDKEELKDIAQKILDSNEKAVLDYKNGKESVIMYLVGQLMKETKGNADAQSAKDILENLLK